MFYLVLLFVFIVILRFLYKFVFDEPTLKKYKHPYKEPGLLYFVNYGLYRAYLALFHRRVNRLNDYDATNGRSATDYGIIPKKLCVDVELHQPSKPQMMDELKIVGVDMKNGYLLDLCMSRHSDKTGRCWLNLITKDHQSKVTKHYEIPSKKSGYWLKESAEGDCWKAHDLSIWCMEPMKKWRILFNGFLRDRLSGEVDQVKFSFIWRPYTRALDHAECASDQVLADALAKSSEVLPIRTIGSILNQYDQWGSFYGSFAVNGQEEVEMILRGNKTRHIGNFNWEDVHRYINIKLLFEDGTVVSINAISLTTGSITEMVWGYVELCRSETNKITGTDFELPMLQSFEDFPALFSFRLVTDGEEYVINLEKESEVTTNTWGPTKWPCLDIKVSRLRASMVNLTQHLYRQGAGTVHYGIGKEIVGEDQSLSSTPLLRPLNVSDNKIKNKRLLEFTDQACTDSNLTGGKGSSLAMLTSISKQMFSVPAGFCVTISAYDQHVHMNSEISKAIKRITEVCCGTVHVGSVQQASDELEKLFLASKLSAELRNDISSMLLKLFGSSFEDKRFAVRSSAAGEDGEEMSGAGQMETFLGCKGLDHICDAIVKCWASLYGFKAVEYRRQNGQNVAVGMSVVVQQMVRADVAGVLFTRDPRTGDSHIMSVSANAGLGESVVSATCDPDTINITRTHDGQLSIREIINGKKEVKVMMTEDEGVKTVEVDVDERNKCCLTTEQALELANIGLHMERCYGDPRDIEWAYFEGKPYLLQSRPITSLDQMSDFEHMQEFNTPLMTDKDQVTAGNIKEVMSGASSPITSTYLYEMFAMYPQKLGYLLGNPISYNPQQTRRDFSYKWHRFFNRIEFHFNVNLKYPTLNHIQTTKSMDITLNGRIINNDLIKDWAIERKRYISWYALHRSMLSGINAIMFTKRRIKQTKEKFENFSFKHENCDSAEKLAKALLNDTEPYIEAFASHIFVTVASSFMNTKVLISLMKSADDVTDDHYSDFATLMSVKNDGEEVESADVPAALKKLANEIQKVITAEQFSAMSKQEVVEWFKLDSNSAKKMYEDFIEKHGHRCMREFDVVSKTWSMDPTQLVDPLKAILNTKQKVNIHKLSIDEAISKLKTPLTTSEKAEIKKMVLQALKNVAFREQTKSLLIRTVHEYRKEFIRLGNMMVAEGRIPDPDYVFYMSHIEIEQLIRTRSSAIIQRVMRRKKLMPQLNKLQFPEISTGYPKPIESVKYVAPADGSAVTMEGTPVSQGIVEAPARVVLNIEDAGSIQPGDILITTSTDIAWSPYFPSLSGVITELGGLISHGAVVAREYGIPCVVGAEGATSVFKSGNIIRMNGNNGKIEKLQD